MVCIECRENDHSHCYDTKHHHAQAARLRLPARRR